MSRHDAYTTPRGDVAALVPVAARSILDLGCSDGSLGASLRSDGRRVVGVESSPELVPLAADRLDAVHQLDLNASDWFGSLDGERFDAVILADVLEHLPTPDDVLAAVLRDLLAPGGSVVISLPNVRHVSALWEIAARGTFPRRDRGLFDSTHLRWYTWREVLAMTEAHGLQIEEWSTNIRLVDRPGAPVNERLDNLVGRWRQRGPIREFLAYQFVLRATPHK